MEYQKEEEECTHPISSRVRDTIEKDEGGVTVAKYRIEFCSDCGKQFDIERV